MQTIFVKLEKASNAFSGFAFTPSLPPSSWHFSFHGETSSLRPLPATGCNTHIFTWKISPSKKGWSPFKIIQIIYFFTSTQVYMCPKIWDFIPFHSYLWTYRRWCGFFSSKYPISRWEGNVNWSETRRLHWVIVAPDVQYFTDYKSTFAGLQILILLALENSKDKNAKTHGFNQTWNLSKDLQDRRFQSKKFTQKTRNFRHLLPWIGIRQVKSAH